MRVLPIGLVSWDDLLRDTIERILEDWGIEPRPRVSVRETKMMHLCGTVLELRVVARDDLVLHTRIELDAARPPEWLRLAVGRFAVESMDKLLDELTRPTR